MEFDEALRSTLTTNLMSHRWDFRNWTPASRHLLLSTGIWAVDISFYPSTNRTDGADSWQFLRIKMDLQSPNFCTETSSHNVLTESTWFAVIKPKLTEPCKCDYLSPQHYAWQVRWLSQRHVPVAKKCVFIYSLRFPPDKKKGQSNDCMLYKV